MSFWRYADCVCRKCSCVLFFVKHQFPCSLSIIRSIHTLTRSEMSEICIGIIGLLSKPCSDKKVSNCILLCLKMSVKLIKPTLYSQQKTSFTTCSHPVVS